MPAPQKNALFYGWKLAALAMLGNFMLQGGAVYLMNAFIQPFSELYGWSRGDISTALGVGSFCGMAAAPLFASLALRVSLRAIMLAGAIAGGAALFLLGQFSDFRLFMACLCVLWITSQACGGVIANALMSNWFVKHRGKAFGIVNAGTSFSGAVLPFAALVLIQFFTVKTATAIMGASALLILVPGVWFFVRDAPASMGLHPDGALSPPGNGSPDDAPHAMDPSGEEEAAPTVRELLRNPLVYRVGIAFALGILAAAGVVGQLKPRFSDLGFGDFPAMAFMCMTAFFAASGKFLWGWVCDRYPPIRTGKILFAYSVFAYLLAFLPPSAASLGAFALFGGLAMGGVWSVLPAVVVTIFGRAHFMAVYRVISLFIFFKSFGYIVMGQAYQLTGSYDAAFAAFSLICVLCFFLLPGENARYVKPRT